MPEKKIYSSKGILASIAFTLIFSVTYYIALLLIGIGARALVFIPAMLAGRFGDKRTGFLGGLLTSLLAIGLNYSIFNDPSLFLNLGTLIGIIILIAVGTMNGHFSEIQNSLIIQKKALDQQNQFFETLININPIATVVLDVDHHISECNPAFENLFKYQQSEIVGKEIDDLIVPKENLDTARELSITAQKESIYLVTKRKNKIGELIDVEIFGMPVVVGGENIGSLALYHNITELKSVERELMSSEARYRALIEDQIDIICRWKIDGTRIFINSSYAKLNNQSVEKLLETNYLEEQSNKQREKIINKINKLKPDNPVEIDDYFTELPNGEKRWVKWIDRGIFDDQGQLVEIQTIGQDIHERKTLEEKLKIRSSALEAAANGIVITNADGNILWANPAFSFLTGYQNSEVRGKTLSFLNSGKHPSKFYKNLWQTISEGYVWHGEIINKHKSGTLYTEEMTITPILNSNDEITHYIAIKQDITERKQAEEELHNAKRDAEEAAITKANFLANMSHEIRTPLNAVVGLSSLLMGTKMDDEQLDFVQTIRESSDALLAIINDILDYSKIEAGKLSPEKQPVYLRNIIESSLDLLARKASAKKIDLAYILDEKVPTKLISDPTRIRQILVNLVNNGIKFTETGEVVVEVTSKHLEGEIFQFLFEVRDTGIGIPEDRVGKLFKSFTQVDDSTTRKYGGTGLGLAISKQLSELMGGKMWVTSEEGKGSSFFFTIKATVSPATSQLEPLGEQPVLRGLRVLIVDDNKTNRLILKKQLDSWGMTPFPVESGLEALTLCQKESFDLAILDMQMPEMDGLTLAEKMKTLETCRDIPLIMFSSIGGHLDDPRYSLFTAYITKPLKPSQLFDKLITVIEDDTNKTKKRKVEDNQSFDENLSEKLPYKILLVEDNIINQKVAVKLLEKFGYRVDLAANGLEAIQALERQHYDLIFMDIQMPEMDGKEATKIIREKLKLETQPWIVAMTAHALEGDRENFLEAGVDDYVSKPINVKELIRSIKQAFAKNND